MRAVKKELLLVVFVHEPLYFRYLHTIRLPRGEGVRQCFSLTLTLPLTAVRGPPYGRRQRRLALRLPQQLGARVGQRRGPHHLDAPRTSRWETPREPGRHDGKIARELGVVAIRRTPLVELRHKPCHDLVYILGAFSRL